MAGQRPSIVPVYEMGIDEDFLREVEPNDDIVYDFDKFVEKRVQEYSVGLRSKRKELERLFEVWSTLGLGKKYTDERVYGVLVPPLEQVDQLVHVDEVCLQKLTKYIDDRMVQINTMLSDLHLDAYVRPTDVSLLRQGKILQNKFNELKFVKEERLSHLQKLKEDRDSLCNQLGREPDPLKFATNIPSEAELSSLRTYVGELRSVTDKRLKEYRQLKSGLKKIYISIEKLPKDNPDEEKRQIEKLNHFEKLVFGEEKNFMLSEDNMNKLLDLVHQGKKKEDENKEKMEALYSRLEYLLEKLELLDDLPIIRNKYQDKFGDVTISAVSQNELAKYEQMRKERMSEFIEKIQEEVKDWWEKICVTDHFEEEFRSTKLAILEPDSEELLQAWEDEYHRVKEFYANHQHIYESLDTWRSSWEQFEELERKERDPDRYKNRRVPSTQIQKESQMKKKLDRDIRTLEVKLTNWSDQMEIEGKSLTIYGFSLATYVSSKRVGYEEAKENEKKQKAADKNAKVIQDSNALKRAASRGGGLVVPRTAGGGPGSAAPTPTRKRQANTTGGNGDLSPSKLTRQHSITRCKIPNPRPIGGLSSAIATPFQGRPPACEMSLASGIDECEFKTGIGARLEHPNGGYLYKTSSTFSLVQQRHKSNPSTPLKDFHVPTEEQQQHVNLRRKLRRSRSCDPLPRGVRGGLCFDGLAEEMDRLRFKSPGTMTTPSSPVVKRKPIIKRNNSRPPFR